MDNRLGENDGLLEHIYSDFKSCITHGIMVSNIAGELAVRLGCSDEEVYNIRLAGMLHDMGKLKLSEYLYGRNSGAMSIAEIKYMRMHSNIGYDYLSDNGFAPDVAEGVLRHHECMDGSGYPDNLKGENIPLASRILRVADTFSALISDRPYRKAFDMGTAILIMIDEIKNYDMRVFLEFQRLVHEDEVFDFIKNCDINLDDLDIRDILIDNLREVC